MKRVLSVAPTRHLLALVGLAFAASVGSLTAADHYYVNDHLATTTAVTDAAGEIAAIEADAFGTPVAGAAQAARYTGKPYDDDIGAFVFPFRNYRSDEARWMSADPSGFPDGVNASHYAPLVMTQIDPLGLKVVKYSETWTRNVIYTRTYEKLNSTNGNSTTNGSGTNSAITNTGTGSLTVGLNNSITVGGSTAVTDGSQTSNSNSSNQSSTSGWGTPEKIADYVYGTKAALFSPPDIPGYEYTGWVGGAPTDTEVLFLAGQFQGSDTFQSRTDMYKYKWQGSASYKKSTE